MIGGISCRYFTIRSKKGVKMRYCRYLKKEVASCYGCQHRENRSVKQVRKISKKRIFVSKATYDKVFARDEGKCAFCGTTQNLNYHHILYRSQRKDLIDVPSNGILLCQECHSIAHSNKKKYQLILLDIIAQKKK